MKELKVGGISIQLERKKIKNMYLRVHPDGRVTMSVPLRTSETQCLRFAEAKFSWIRKTLEKKRAIPQIEELQYVTGEEHSLFGKPYELVVQAGRSQVLLREDKMLLFCREGADLEQRKLILDKWYREQLQEAIPPVAEHCEKIVGQAAAEWRIRDMKTRWGTCNVRERRIWLSLQLAKKPLECLEYVITHELVHFYRKNHDAVFYEYMDLFYPKWRDVKDLLNGRSRK